MRVSASIIHLALGDYHSIPEGRESQKKFSIDNFQQLKIFISYLNEARIAIYENWQVSTINYFFVLYLPEDSVLHSKNKKNNDFKNKNIEESEKIDFFVYHYHKHWNDAFGFFV